jgi:small subunit ribosomal protein S27e
MQKAEAKIPKPRTRFLKVKCSGCGNEQIIFSNASKSVKCLACDNVLAESAGGKVRLRAKIVKELD